MEKPKSLTLILRTSESSMTIDLSFDDDQPKSEKDEKKNKIIVKILEEFSHLSPERQEEVIKYIEFLEKQAVQKDG